MRDRVRERTFPSTDLLSKCLHRLKLCHNKAGSTEPNLNLLCRWQEPSHLSHHCCLPGPLSVGSWKGSLSCVSYLGTPVWHVDILTARSVVEPYPRFSGFAPTATNTNKWGQHVHGNNTVGLLPRRGLCTLDSLLQGKPSMWRVHLARSCAAPWQQAAGGGSSTSSAVWLSLLGSCICSPWPSCT